MQLGDYKRAVVRFGVLQPYSLHIGWCSEEQHCFRQFSATTPVHSAYNSLGCLRDVCWQYLFCLGLYTDYSSCLKHATNWVQCLTRPGCTQVAVRIDIQSHTHIYMPRSVNLNSVCMHACIYFSMHTDIHTHTCMHTHTHMHTYTHTHTHRSSKSTHFFMVGKSIVNTGENHQSVLFFTSPTAEIAICPNAPSLNWSIVRRMMFKWMLFQSHLFK